MKLLVFTLVYFLLMSCNSERLSANENRSSDSTEVKTQTNKPNITESLPPNTAKVILSFQGSVPDRTDSLKVTQAIIKEFIESGSSSPILSKGERINLKISSSDLRNSLLDYLKHESSSSLEVIIKYTPTIAFSTETSNQEVWSLIQIDSFK